MGQSPSRKDEGKSTGEEKIPGFYVKQSFQKIKQSFKIKHENTTA
jgi:hypothetical protein